ncbi:hypothetical protein J22TS1_41380 [Siminovitchia terrae]|nr:hypothetical protein J22TS1_41380 [Siminovitchia terrae]
MVPGRDPQTRLLRLYMLAIIRIFPSILYHICSLFFKYEFPLNAFSFFVYLPAAQVKMVVLFPSTFLHEGKFDSLREKEVSVGKMLWIDHIFKGSQ